MSKRNQFWRELQLSTLQGILDAIATAHRVRVYPSQKYPGWTMLKIQNSAVEYTGKIPDVEFPALETALDRFTATPDKKATVYTRKTTVETRLYLEYAITAIEAAGWHPANSRGKPTWLEAHELYQDRQPINMEAITQADEIIEVMSQPESSDYGRRLANILEGPEAWIDNLPVLASAPIALKRRRAREAAAQASQHVGKVDEVIELDYLEVIYRRWVDTRNGPVKLYKLRDPQGNHFSAWVSERFERVDEWHTLSDMQAAPDSLPARFAAQATITAHHEYQGVKETVINIAPLSIRQLEICPGCGGRYDQNACTCILEPANYLFQPDSFDIEIGVVDEQTH